MKENNNRVVSWLLLIQAHSVAIFRVWICLLAALILVSCVLSAGVISAQPGRWSILWLGPIGSLHAWALLRAYCFYSDRRYLTRMRQEADLKREKQNK